VVQLPAAIDGELELAQNVDGDTACVIGQSPNVFGTVTDMTPVSEAAHAQKALFVSVFTETVSLGMVTPPGEMGADIAVGEGQSIGNPLTFGGPYVEQHIRRDKATSNICTNAGLCALAFTAHMTLLGDKGLTHLAALNHETACDLADALEAIDGVELLTPRFFNEFAIRVRGDAHTVLADLEAKGVLGGVRASRLFGSGNGDGGALGDAGQILILA